MPGGTAVQADRRGNTPCLEAGTGGGGCEPAGSCSQQRCQKQPQQPAVVRSTSQQLSEQQHSLVRRALKRGPPADCLSPPGGPSLLRAPPSSSKGPSATKGLGQESSPLHHSDSCDLVQGRDLERDLVCKDITECKSQDLQASTGDPPKAVIWEAPGAGQASATAGEPITGGPVGLVPQADCVTAGASHSSAREVLFLHAHQHWLSPIIAHPHSTFADPVHGVPLSVHSITTGSYAVADGLRLERLASLLARRTFRGLILALPTLTFRHRTDSRGSALRDSTGPARYGRKNLTTIAKDKVRRDTLLALRAVDLGRICLDVGVPFLVLAWQHQRTHLFSSCRRYRPSGNSRGASSTASIPQRSDSSSSLFAA